MASFTTRVKDEMTRLETNKLESMSEVCAYLKSNAKFSDDAIVITFENNGVARRVFILLKKIYGINIKLTIRTQKKFTVKTVYILEIHEKIDIITSDVMNTYKNILDYSDEERTGYIRGLFLANGSINDPSKSKYHLEFLVNDEELSILIVRVLGTFRFKAKLLKRDKGYMVYIKSSEEISDFIKLLGTVEALFYYEDIRIYRDHKNMVNRLNNCEQANVEKSMKTCREQLDNINYLQEHDLIVLLDDKSKIVTEYRIKYPETSMSELAEIISLETDYNITKSGINHHFRKIKDLVTKAKEREANK